jgi:hypothetical protein
MELVCVSSWPTGFQQCSMLLSGRPRAARSVLLAALSILPYSAVDAARSEAEAELEKDRSMRVANLLGFSVVRARRGAAAWICFNVKRSGCRACVSSACCGAPAPRRRRLEAALVDAGRSGCRACVGSACCSASGPRRRRLEAALIMRGAAVVEHASALHGAMASTLCPVREVQWIDVSRTEQALSCWPVKGGWSLLRRKPARTQRSNQRAPALKAARRAQDARRDARSALSRGALVADLGAKGVLNLVPEEIKQAWLRSAHAVPHLGLPDVPPALGRVCLPACSL